MTYEFRVIYLKHDQLPRNKIGGYGAVAELCTNRGGSAVEQKHRPPEFTSVVFKAEPTLSVQLHN